MCWVNGLFENGIIKKHVQFSSLEMKPKVRVTSFHVFELAWQPCHITNALVMDWQAKIMSWVTHWLCWVNGLYEHGSSRQIRCRTTL